jgi:uncharacterized protein
MVRNSRASSAIAWSDRYLRRVDNGRMSFRISRRGLLRGGAAVVAGGALHRTGFAAAGGAPPLEEVGYGQVTLKSAPHLDQMDNVRSVLMELSDDSLLMPFRKMAGQNAPGEDLGGWYQYLREYDYRHGDAGFAPGATFGQWVSALARMVAVSGDETLRQRVLRLNQLYAQTISREYFAKTRFPAYSFDKLLCGLMDSHRLAGDDDAFEILERTLNAAEPELPGHAVEHDVAWRPGKDPKDISWAWDESYTSSENLYLVSAQMGVAGRRYREMADRYLDDAAYFDPLARGENVMWGRHAYSYVNSLCSAMQAYMVGGSAKHLQAARNGFDLLVAQSFATGGWGPDETLRKPASGEVFASLTETHNTFETPCGAYAHMKLTRYLLRCTREGRYGDSMERMMYNTVLGSLPMHTDGRAFYYSDYYSGSAAKDAGSQAAAVGAVRVYSAHRWPCCAGTLPQVVADYWINGYFREPGAVWVNLYLPSVLRWTEGDAKVEMELEGAYPENGRVRMRLKSSQPVSFALKLRIPAWADGASARVNEKPVEMSTVAGFATIRRKWQTGDVVDLDLPMRLRMEVLDAAHPETVAVMFGPRVLFALAAGPVKVTRTQVFAARQAGGGEWTMDSANGPLRMVPFTSVGENTYSTYIRVSA